MHVTADKSPAPRVDWREQETIKVEEAAVVLGINRQAAYAAARYGELPAVRIGKRLIVPVPALRRGSSERSLTTPTPEWAGFHTFRHTIASRMFAAGRNAVQVQHWLGHHSAAFTLATYVHLLDGDLGGPLVLPAHAAAER